MKRYEGFINLTSIYQWNTIIVQRSRDLHNPFLLEQLTGYYLDPIQRRRSLKSTLRTQKTVELGFIAPFVRDYVEV